MLNIHMSYNIPHNGELSLHYGPCTMQDASDSYHTVGSTYVGDHQLARRHLAHKNQRPTNFVWLPPLDTPTGGCLHAFSGASHLGTSGPVELAKRKQRRWTAAADIMDAQGPWFDGVAYLREKQPDDVFVAAAKSKKIGILGAGMSGLMTAHLLDSVGFHDCTLVEASWRIGGRVRTSYLNATDADSYQYQEMGPMRLPVSITYADTEEPLEIIDRRIVFQLADELYKQNGEDSDYAVNFIPWIQSSRNTPISTSFRRPDGTVPGTSEVEENRGYQGNANATYSNATAVALAGAALENWADFDREKMASFARNIFQAHNQAVEDGYFDFSEAGYLKYALRLDNNITDQAVGLEDDDPTWHHDNVYFSATELTAIDKEFSMLPQAFGPQVLNRTVFGTATQGMVWNETTEKMRIEHRNKKLFDVEPETMEFDYTVVTVPFSKVRLWRLPDYTSLLARAIDSLNYEQACKIALHYRTRFWEHLERPIIGGCGSTDIPGIGAICYPSYEINSTRPGVILASYASRIVARSLGALTQEQHVALVQRAMIEIHGPVAQEQCTGANERVCWEQDEFQAGGWAAPTVSQQPLYLPAYFHTEVHRPPDSLMLYAAR